MCGSCRTGARLRTRVGVVDADHLEAARAQRLLPGLRDLARLHVRRLVEGHLLADGVVSTTTGLPLLVNHLFSAPLQHTGKHLGQEASEL